MHPIVAHGRFSSTNSGHRLEKRSRVVEGDQQWPMPDQITLKHLVGAAHQALKEVAERSLSTQARIAEALPHAIPGMCGSVITLTGGRTRACVGFSSTHKGCREIAGAMLGLDPSDIDDLSHDDVRDSVAELVNIVAGRIKTILVDVEPQLALGLPVHVEGTFEGVARSQTVYMPCHVGEIGCVMTLLAVVDCAA